MNKYKKRIRQRLRKPTVDQRLNQITKSYNRLKQLWDRTIDYYNVDVEIPSQTDMMLMIEEERPGLSAQEVASEMSKVYRDFFEDELPYKPRTYKQAEVIQCNLQKQFGVHYSIQNIIMGNLPTDILQIINTGKYQTSMGTMSFYRS